MKPNFALDLSHEGINLLHRSGGGWTLVGSVALDASDMGARLEELRRSAAMLESGGFTSKLIIPESQVLYTTLAAPGPDDISREVQIRAALDGLTPYPVGDLVFDWRAQGDKARVAVLARETMDEAEAFAAEHKFNPVSFAARPARGTFSGEPFFGKTKAASTLLAPGERVEPDASPIPANPKAKTLPEEARVDPAQTDASAPAPSATAPDPAANEALQSAAPQPPAPDTSAANTVTTSELGDPFADLDRIADDDAPATPEPAEKPRKPRPKKGKSAAPRVSAPDLAPFPPTPGEESATPVAKARPAPPSGNEPAKPGPATEPKAKPTSPIAFASRRIAASAPHAETAGKPIRRLDDMAARIGNAERHAPAKAPARKIEPVSRIDFPVGEDASRPALPHDRLRADMADALAKPLPTPDNPFTKPDNGGGVFARLSSGASAAVGRASAAARDRAAARAAAKEAKDQAQRAETAAEPTANSPEDSAETRADRGFLGLRRRPSDEDEQRNREAEAMTVFGARGSQTGAGRPKYLGLILTLALVLVMAVVAVWSTFLVDKGGTDRFNPDTAATTPDTTNVAPADSANAGAGSTSEAATGTSTPDVTPTTTAEVLSPEAAAARYAATGIWQRAPDVPNGPETPRIGGLDTAALDEAAPSRAAAALPPDTSHGVDDAALAAPVPPPPAGASFDLDANGLVIATPEGALSPTGIMVFSGRPATVPPAPPGGLFPEPETTTAPAPADGQPIQAPDIPRIRPHPRPAGLIPPLPAAAPAGTTGANDHAAVTPPPTPPGEAGRKTELAAIDAAVDDVIQASLVNATELAVATSAAPSRRPKNFAAIVDSALASASDGSSVIASAAPVGPVIPTAANVATQATTRNALRLSDINLIGIYGSSSARRALVRLKSGRYVKVEVGDRLNGGRVTSISASRLTYQKGSRAHTLQVLPLG